MALTAHWKNGDIIAHSTAEQALRPIDLLYRGLARNANAVALDGGRGEALTYAALVAAVESLATAFQSLDPMPGSRVGICAYNTREHLLALLATYAAGKVWVPLNPRNGKAELDAMIAATQPSLVVADESCVDRFTPPGVPSVLAKTDHGRAGLRTIDELLIEFRDQQPTVVPRAAEDEQIIKFSGGSTGRPKAVIQSARCVNAQAAGLSEAFGFDQSDRNLIAAPLTHGTSCFILPILAAGGSHVLLEEPRPAALLDLLVTSGITTVYLPPTLIYLLLRESGVADRRYPALRHLIYSAAPMSADRIRAAQRTFGPVIETAYGQVEAPQIITAMRASELTRDENLASVGRPSTVVRVAIMSDTGRLLGAGEEGEIVVQGDLVMSGYLGQPELTARTIVDGWLHTGDLGLLDARGYLFIRGRLRELINSGGFKVFPADVEAVLSRHPAVAECVVFGMPDAHWGEAVHAAVALRASSAASERDLITFVKGELDSVKAPKRIHFVDALPKNPAGKVSRVAVRALIAGD
jgi:acyl-CoA synthetase (AMP-forming)/AMP-acid ligase II